MRYASFEGRWANRRRSSARIVRRRRRAAEGFRCPLYPLDRVADVASALVDLMRDCRVTDIRMLAGVHPDRAANTGLPLLFKPDTIPASAHVTLH